MKKYVGDMVLGMHDALVSQTGIAAGLAFTLADNRLIMLAGMIAAVSASLSMTASNYLARQADGGRHAMLSGLYTGAAYLGAAAMLLTPFALTHDTRAAFFATLAVAIAIIFLFNFCTRRRGFLRRSVEMLLICTVVSACAFAIGQMAQMLLTAT